MSKVVLLCVARLLLLLLLLLFVVSISVTVVAGASASLPTNDDETTGGNNDKDTTTTTTTLIHDESTTTTTTTLTNIYIGTKQSSSSTKTPIYYNPPFTTEYYPNHVVNVLQKYPVSTDNTPTDTDIDHEYDDVDQEDVHQLLLASWYVDLGIAHRTAIEEYYLEHLDTTTTTTTGSTTTTDSMNNKKNKKVTEIMNGIDSTTTNDTNNFLRIQTIYAVASFTEAIKIYEQLIVRYQDLYIDEQQQQQNSDATTTATSIMIDETNGMIQTIIMEYEQLLANTIFALAETYTLLNDWTLGFTYYHRAYRIYQQQLNATEQHNNSDENDDEEEEEEYNSHTSSSTGSNMKTYYAHCSVQLGLELIHYLYNDVMQSDDGPTTTDTSSAVTNTPILSLSEIVQSSTSNIQFNSRFWRDCLNSFRIPGGAREEEGSAGSGTTQQQQQQQQQQVDDELEYTLESVQNYVSTQYARDDDDDVETLTNMLIIQYIRTEQAILYFTDAAVIFRIEIIQQQNKDEHNNNNNNNIIILEHQQTLVNVLENLASCIYQYQTYVDGIGKAIEYYEEAYDILSLQILPTLQRESSNGPVIRSTVRSITDILFQLTEMYFSLGNDEMSKGRMLLCLQYHNEYQLDPPLSIDPLFHGSMTVDDDIVDAMDGNNESPISTNEQMQMYEQMLEEYYSLFKVNGIKQPHAMMNDDELLMMDESNGYVYEKDDIFEADIHVSIGTLYMGSDRSSSITHAISHFEQAVRLYEMSSGEVPVENGSTTNMALAKYNLFLLHLRDGNYPVAAHRYNEAIDLLRTIDMTTTDAGMYNEYNDQFQKLRSHQPYKSSKLQQQTKESMTLLKSESSTIGKGNDKIRESNQDDVVTHEKNGPSIYVDLQHFLNQNHSSKEEL